MNKPTVSVVIPTYNEAENIKVFIPSIERVFSDIKHEIIIVDDSSPDGTGRVASDLDREYNNIRLVTKLEKEGIGSALREGYDYASNEVIISSDADLSFSAEDMRRLYEKIAQEGYDFVVGVRHGVKGSYYEMDKPVTRLKGLTSRAGNFVLGLLCGINIHDFSANFRAIRKDRWKEIKIKEKTNIVLFEMIVKAKQNRLKITEIPVSFRERVYGKSKLNLLKEVCKAVFKGLYYIIVYRISAKTSVKQEIREARI